MSTVYHNKFINNSYSGLARDSWLKDTHQTHATEVRVTPQMGVDSLQNLHHSLMQISFKSKTFLTSKYLSCLNGNFK